MKTRKPDVQRVVERNLSPGPEFMQKYSYEVGNGSRRKPTSSMSNGGSRQGASWKTGSKRRN